MLEAREREADYGNELKWATFVIRADIYCGNKKRRHSSIDLGGGGGAIRRNNMPTSRRVSDSQLPMDFHVPRGV